MQLAPKIRGLAVIALAFVAIAAAQAQQVTINVASYIQGALGQYNGGYYLAGALPNANIQWVDSSGNPQGPVTSGSVGASITVSQLGNLGVGLSVSYTLALSSDGHVIIKYESVVGVLKVSGQVWCRETVTGLPGWNPPGSGGGSVTYDDTPDYQDTYPDGNQTNNIPADTYDAPDFPTGEVIIGDPVVVDWWE